MGFDCKISVRKKQFTMANTASIAVKNECAETELTTLADRVKEEMPDFCSMSSLSEAVGTPEFDQTSWH